LKLPVGLIERTHAAAAKAAEMARRPKAAAKKAAVAKAGTARKRPDTSQRGGRRA
jgi:hypothetical protein